MFHVKLKINYEFGFRVLQNMYIFGINTPNIVRNILSPIICGREMPKIGQRITEAV
jgi:hypothetical protein